MLFRKEIVGILMIFKEWLMIALKTENTNVLSITGAVGGKIDSVTNLVDEDLLIH